MKKKKTFAIIFVLPLDKVYIESLSFEEQTISANNKYKQTSKYISTMWIKYNSLINWNTCWVYFSVLASLWPAFWFYAWHAWKLLVWNLIRLLVYIHWFYLVVIIIKLPRNVIHLLSFNCSFFPNTITTNIFQALFCASWLLAACSWDLCQCDLVC